MTLARSSYDDNISLLYRKVNEVFQRNWESRVRVTKKGQALKDIKEKVATWSWALNKNRAIETGLARLRMGHVGLRQHLHRFSMADTPLCECGEVENIVHFLLDCPNSVQARNQMTTNIKNCGITNQVTVKLLLGGSDLPEYQQMIIVSEVSKFLVVSGRIHEL